MDSLYVCALSEIGHDGPFQRKFDIIYNIMLAGLWVMAYNNIILVLTVTPHECKLSEKPDNFSEYDWKAKYIPIVQDAAGGEKFSDCLVYLCQESNETKGCDYYDYDKSWFATTVPSENNWVCENELNVANIFAYSKIGELIGSFFFGWFGDVYGRKPTYIISLVMLVIGRFTSVIASSSFILFATGCIIASFPSWSATQSTAIISLEISSPKRRSIVAKLRLIASSFGMCLMPFFYWRLRNWKPFLIITTATQVPYVLLSWKLIESPQWLWVNKDIKKCIKCLKHISKVNKTTLSTDTESEILSSGPAINTKTEAFSFRPLALFSSSRLAIITILQLLMWVSVSVNYTVVLMSSMEKSNGNPFLDFAWQSLAEIPGYFVGAWLADHIGRRYTGISSSALTSFIWTLFVYREICNTRWFKNYWLSTILAVTNRLSITISYYIINLFNIELYPTSIRQSGMSLGNVVSGGASALAPYILYLGRRFDVRYTYVILIVTTLLGGVVTSFFLPETLNAKLPETVEDAQRFGRRDRTSHISVRWKEETVELNIPAL